MARSGGELLVDGLAVTVQGTGGPVVLAHAGVTDSRVWHEVVPALLADGRQVVRYDARGLGRSARPTAEHSLVADAVQVLDALDLVTVDWVGLSQGAATGVDLALAAPARVRSLALVAPGLSGWQGRPLPGREARLAAYERGDAAALAVEVLRLWGPLSFDERGQVRDEPASRVVLEQAEWFLADPGHERAEPSAVPRLGEVAVPTLVVVGSDDTDETRSIARLLADEVPRARLVVLPDADHLLPLRVPGALSALLVAHLPRRRRTRARPRRSGAGGGPAA